MSAPTAFADRPLGNTLILFDGTSHVALPGRRTRQGRAKAKEGADKVSVTVDGTLTPARRVRPALRVLCPFLGQDLLCQDTAD